MKPKVFIDKNGNLEIHKNVPFGGEMSPKLRPREWFYWILSNAEGNKEKAEEYIKNMVGCSTTIWRIKKSLKAKKYL